MSIANTWWLNNEQLNQKKNLVKHELLIDSLITQ